MTTVEIAQADFAKIEGSLAAVRAEIAEAEATKKKIIATTKKPTATEATKNWIRDQRGM